MADKSSEKEKSSPTDSYVSQLFDAAKQRIESLIRQDVPPEEVRNPERQHLPELINMEEYEDWVKDETPFAMMQKRQRKERTVGEKIDVADLFKDVTTSLGDVKKCRHVMALGSAGTGKTTLLRRIAHQSDSRMLEGKLVLMPDFRTYSLDGTVLPAEALLGDLFDTWDEERMGEMYKWMLQNSDKIAFFVDSIDTLPFDLINERERIGHYTPSKIDVIVHNLLAKDLFRESLIISSSREYKVRSLHPSVRPDRCIILDGLKRDSVEDLIDGYLGESQGTEVKEHIDTECPDVWPLLSIPVFLTFSVVGFVKSGFKPSTMSGILTKLFQSLVTSSHAHVKDIFTVVKKLMRLSFEGMRSGCVLFTPEDLGSVGLTPDQVKDLGIFIPRSGGTYFTSRLIQNHRFYLYFKHQTQQEFLAALHILAMDVKDFSDFIKHGLFETTFTVVRRLVCGILLCDEVLEGAKELTKIPDAEKKKELLLQSLANAIKRCESKENLLELFIDFNESKHGATELIRSSISEINFSQTSLSPSDVHAVASVMKHCNYLEVVSLWNSNLDEDKMEILSKIIMKSNLKIGKLDVGGKDMGDKGMVRLAKFVKHCQVKSLGILSSMLSWNRMAAFLDGESSLKLYKLDVSGNHDLGPKGIGFLGKVVKKHQVKDVCATWCNVKVTHVKELVIGLEDAKVDYLDLEDRWGKPVFGRPLLELLPHVEKELNLSGWKITKEQEGDIQKKLDGIASRSLTVTFGDKREPTCLQAVLKEPSSVDGLFAAIDRRIKTKSVKDEIIGTNGGSIQNFGSKYTFQPEAFDGATKVQTIVSTDFSDCLEDRVRIAPLVGCIHDRKLRLPAKLEVEHWGFPTGEGVSVEVYRKETESSEWVFFKEIPIARNEKITFMTDSFSFFEFVVKCVSAIWSRVRPSSLHVSLQNVISISGSQKTFACIFFVKDDKVRNDVTLSLKEKGYKPLLAIPQTVNVRKDCNVEATLKSMNPDPLRLIAFGNNNVGQQNIEPSKEVQLSFPVRKVLSDCDCNQQILLRGLRADDGIALAQDLLFDYSVTANNDQLCRHPLQIVWPIPAEPAPSNITEVDFHGPVRADMIILPNTGED